MRQIKSNPSYLPGLPKYISFVDEAGHSLDPRQQFLCLAGLLVPESAWNAFDIDWRDACTTADVKRPFHMKDFVARRRQFIGWSEGRRRELLGELLAAIIRADAVPIGSVVSLAGYRTLAPLDKARLKDPHFMAFQSLTFHIAAAAEMKNQPGPVTMVYAHHPQHSRGRGSTRQLWDALRKYNPIVSMFMEDYVCDPLADEPGLDAADLWAYELRHHFEVIRPAGQEPRWPFKQFVKLGLNYEFTHDFVTFHDEHGANGLGKMSRVTRLGEIDLYRPGFVGLHPTKARKLDLALRSLAGALSSRDGRGNGRTNL